MIQRPQYLKKLNQFKDTKTIKVITGMRRSGKSTLLLLYRDALITQGVDQNQIIHINFESFKYQHIQSAPDPYHEIENRMAVGKKTYVLLDEIQMIEGWEKAVNSMLVDYDVDVYLTGSNAYLLSSELSTLLSGRYVEIKVLPLSFKEYLSFSEVYAPEDVNQSIEVSFQNYLKYGSLPVLYEHRQLDDVFVSLLQGIYHTVLIKDVLERNKISDTKLLTDVARFAFDNIGNLTSSKKVSDFIVSDGKKITHNTVLNYYQMLENAFILYPARRYDIRGKHHLKTLVKYYLVDMGIRNAVLGYRNIDVGRVLENIVYLELLRRGYEVSVGVFKDFEIDFVAEKLTEKHYYQVTFSLKDQRVADREHRALAAIKDNYPKTILSMDTTYTEDQAGILHRNIIEFLLEEN